MLTVTTSTTSKEVTTAELSAIYDRIYGIADRLFKKYNPCNIHKTKRGKIKCADPYNTTNKLCCSCCERYWSKNGCTIRCLSCKLYICPTLRKDENKQSIFYKRLLKLRAYTRNKFGGEMLWSFYYSKEDWLKQITKQQIPLGGRL